MRLKALTHGAGNTKKRSYHRHSADNTAKLNEAFRECPHPDEKRQRQLSEELGLEPSQIKFWFQNKRTNCKILIERSDSDALRRQNKTIQLENHIIDETLKNVLCESCGGRDLGEEEHKLRLENMRMENVQLTQELQILTKVLASIPGINRKVLQATSSSSSHGISRESVVNQTGEISAPYQRIPILDKLFPPQNAHHAQHIPTHNQPVLAHDQGICHALSQQSYPTLDQLVALNQHMPIVNQDINPSPTPTPNQDIPILTPDLYQPNSVLVQDVPPLITSLDYNIPALITAPDQNIPPVISAHDSIPVVEQAPNHGAIPAITPLLDQDIPSVMNALLQDNPLLNLDLDAILQIYNNDVLPRPVTNSSVDIEKSLMKETAEIAMEELMKLLSMNAPFWFRSLLDGKFILQRESYYKIFPRNNHLMGTHARVESSKDSRLVNMNGTQLVEMFLNSDKWIDLFPTIVKRAQTIQVFDSGSLGSHNGALKLMNAEMHILSPLVPTREFLFIRYCKQIGVGVWVIADVSFDSSKYKTTVSHSWRLPSGCLIQEMIEGLCRVSWVEHVEVDDKIQTHQLFRDLVCGDNAYGAERWVSTLERMCERFASASARTIPISDIGGVVRTIEGRRKVMELSHRIVKDFCGSLDMSDNMDLTRFNNNGIRVCARKYTHSSVSQGIIISAATSFWLPLSPQDVFDFLKDIKRRTEWDVLCYGNAVHEIQHISNGGNPNNCISIIQPSMPNDNNMLILQETHRDDLGSMLVFTPFDMDVINVAINGEDTSTVPVLASGFTISWDGQSNAVEGQLRGSLVTLLHQVLTCTISSANGYIDLKSVGVISTLVSSTVEKIQVSLNC